MVTPVFGSATIDTSPIMRFLQVLSFCHAGLVMVVEQDRKSTRLNSSHTEIYTLSLHDALPIYGDAGVRVGHHRHVADHALLAGLVLLPRGLGDGRRARSEEHTSELQSHRDLHSFPTRRSSDLW